MHFSYDLASFAWLINGDGLKALIGENRVALRDRRGVVSAASS